MHVSDNISAGFCYKDLKYVSVSFEKRCHDSNGRFKLWNVRDLQIMSDIKPYTGNVIWLPNFCSFSIPLLNVTCFQHITRNWKIASPKLHKLSYVLLKTLHVVCKSWTHEFVSVVKTSETMPKESVLILKRNEKPGILLEN